MSAIHRPNHTQPPFERQIQEYLREYGLFLGQSLGFQMPFLQPILRPAPANDHLEIQVVGVMWVEPAVNEEPVNRTFYQIDDWKQAISQLAMTSLRQEHGYLTPGESRAAAEMISTILQKLLDSFAADLGPR